jgi:hypothetical protein
MGSLILVSNMTWHVSQYTFPSTVNVTELCARPGDTAERQKMVAKRAATARACAILPPPWCWAVLFDEEEIECVGL